MAISDDMFVWLGSRRVTAPDGVQWRVGRTWLTKGGSLGHRWDSGLGFKPWVMEAKVVASPAPTRHVERQVRGRRKSRRRIGEVASDLAMRRGPSDRHAPR